MPRPRPPKPPEPPVLTEYDHRSNRAQAAGLVVIGLWLADVPLWAAAVLGAMMYGWCKQAGQWPYAIATAGVAYGLGVAAWAVGLRV